MQESQRVSGGEILFRTVKPADILEVMNINRICLPENYTYGFFEELAKEYPRAFWVAETNNKVVGYIMCRVERIFSKFDFLKIRRAGHIVSIAVLPNYRRKRIGEELVRRAVHALANEYGCEEAYLEVRVNNNPAIQLYKKLGFVTKEIQRRYYADGEDAYVMVLKLPVSF
ncbi:MAG: ribosomal protein S18-alanine N-acetyltransferase [Candidatus Caldarchaeum sp.]|nr:ribosomal protein S18-alanine N-acetyltransferase [Candidatus Caldarchaeum sp.]MCS7133376.1 ribosomal protein S18-alanine N-acetyltransferase [Candidatus Caldarchaeum sp.]MCX8201710.1 ribosomal protein S18-alanine N-acetyltransferase [Candidatus Caldarchaeum sp.]MDW8063710.1 ribosomal protein S18-alanine N-acetyltransferase [Candidatus Caldarchaeum sp.]MDW8435160.1 ribosomal protein S18-alanine N-acetyltransferase [Candidatus Caldarchaeum sp.]